MLAAGNTNTHMHKHHYQVLGQMPTAIIDNCNAYNKDFLVEL